MKLHFLRFCLVILALNLGLANGLMYAAPPAGYKKVTEVDFLKSLGVAVNAQGAHVVKMDVTHQRIVVACVNSSSLAWIEGHTRKLHTIPIGTRLPRRFHPLSLAIDSLSGKFYLAAEKKLVVVEPNTSQVQSIDLPSDLETVAVDGLTGRAFLTGRASGNLVVVEPNSRRVTEIKWGAALPPIPWAAASPPPPIRKVFVDPNARAVYLVDGAAPQLLTFHADQLTLLHQRSLPVPPYPRWHLAAFDTRRQALYLALETETRDSKGVLRIGTADNSDVLIALPPGSREPQGISYSYSRQEVYIPYDNHPYIHVVHLAPVVKVDSIAVPRFGMDASAVDEKRGQLFVTNWAQGILYLINLKTRQVDYSVPQFPVFPHMHHLAYNPVTGDLIVPSGATVVNGTFGASVTIYNTLRNELIHQRIGWGPVSLAPQPGADAFYIFGSDQAFACVQPNGQCTYHSIPFLYPHAVHSAPGQNQVWLSYGQHSSMWPSVYIASTRNGVLKFGRESTPISEIVLDRLAQQLTLDRHGNFWALQNTWGTENPYLAYCPAQGGNWQRVFLPERVDNECSFRLLAADPELDRIYVGRTADLNDQPGTLYIVDQQSQQVLSSVRVGVSPVDICVQPKLNRIIVLNFDSDSATCIDRTTFARRNIPTGDGPLVSAVNPQTGEVCVVNHLNPGLTVLGESSYQLPLPADAWPDNIYFAAGQSCFYVTAHQPQAFKIYRLDLAAKKVSLYFETAYPFGEIRFDHANTAFALRGQWADAIYRLTNLAGDAKGRLWVTDYLAGKLWIFEN